MRKSSENKNSLYFPMVVTKLDHPRLFDYLQGQHERGAAKKLVCDVAEEHLKQDAADEKMRQEGFLIAKHPVRSVTGVYITDEHDELIRRLDEIRELLKTGVSILPTETNDTQENVKQSPKVSGLLSALGL